MKICLFAIMIFCSMAASVAEPKVIDTDLCKIAAHPKQFDNKEVRVRARLFKGMHGSALVDEHCGKGVSLWYLKAAQDHEDFKMLDDILVHHGNVGTSDKKIVATFTGKFFRKKKDESTHKTAMVLEASKVEDLDVKYDNSPSGR
jgi:hypothetical protein